MSPSLKKIILSSRLEQLTKQHRWMLAAFVMVVCIGSGFLLAYRVLRTTSPSATYGGEPLAREITQSLTRNPAVQLATGAYLPGNGVVLFAQTTFTSETEVRNWATTQMGLYASRFKMMPEQEDLIWIINYGAPPFSQMIVEAPLQQTDEVGQYHFVTGYLQSQSTETAPTTSAENLEVPPVQPAIVQSVTDPSLGANEAFANFSSDFENNAEGWRPMSGEWLVADGSYRQNNLDGYDFITMIDRGPLTNYQLSARFKIVTGDQGPGIVYNAPTVDSRNEAQLVDLVDQGTFLRWGFYDEAGTYIYLGGTAIQSSVADENWHTFSLVVSETDSSVYLDNELIGVIDTLRANGYAGLLTSQSQVEFDDVLLTSQTEGAVSGLTITQPVEIVAEASRTEPQVVQQITPIVNSQFDDNATDWLPLTGDWLVENGLYRQNDVTGFDYITMLNSAPLADYSLEARFRYLEGDLGAGFIYNAPEPDRRNGAQLVDLIDQGRFLRWGYYDDNGAYVYQGGVTLDNPVADGEWHTLKLVTQHNTSTILLDDQISTQIENVSSSGYSGLVTSQSRVEFDDVSLIALPPDSLKAVSASFFDDFDDGDASGWQVLAGNWQVSEGTYHQVGTTAYDLGSISTFEGSDYTIEARVRYLEGEMGAGFYFNMETRQAKTRSQMVNFVEAGQAIQWGHFDEGGNFVFDGLAEVPDASDGEWHLLRLDVRPAGATVTLDGQIVASDIPLSYTGGFVGLMVNTSHIAFDDVRIEPLSPTSVTSPITNTAILTEENVISSTAIITD